MDALTIVMIAALQPNAAMQWTPPNGQGWVECVGCVAGQVTNAKRPRDHKQFIADNTHVAKKLPTEGTCHCGAVLELARWTG